MKFSFVSESLIVSGVYLYCHDNIGFGIALVVLGILGGITSFLHFVSVCRDREERKTLIYESVKAIFTNIGQTIYEAGIASGRNSSKNTTVH